jgi:uncharacterized membrane protein
MAMCRSEKRRSNEGFVLIVTCIALAILIGLAGLGIDVGRMYVIQSELQAFADASALNAALQLDGTSNGIARARRAALEFASGPHAMKWDLGTQPISGVVATFATGDALPDPKTWQAEPHTATNPHFVRVVVSVPAPLVFLRVLPAGQSGFSTVAASSVAAKTQRGARLVQ